MTGQDPSPPGRKRVITYWQAHDGYRGTIDARERFDELTNRDLSVRAFATLKARGTYDPDKHGDADKHQPLTASEHLEILAVGEVLARQYRHPVHVDEAVKAGASWSQVAEALGSDETEIRQRYREWAEGQHHLHAYYEGKFGMDDTEYAAAIRRASESPSGPEVEREAEQ
jgi:hypothetical protein